MDQHARKAHVKGKRRFKATLAARKWAKERELMRREGVLAKEDDPSA